MAITRRNEKPGTEVKVTADIIKLALLEYFRFKRGWVCVDEYCNADIIVDTGKEIIEVECKISKSDLINGEKKKKFKHQMLNEIGDISAEELAWAKRRYANKFFFCVPTALREDAKKYAETINPKYGVIEFDTSPALTKRIVIIKSAERLHDNYDSGLRWRIALRTTTKLITLMRTVNSESVTEN